MNIRIKAKRMVILERTDESLDRFEVLSNVSLPCQKRRRDGGKLWWCKRVTFFVDKALK